jgi:nucleoside-diphosphate kinase
VSFITSGPVVAMAVEGPEAVLGCRQIMGATNPLQAVPGSIRGDYATEITFNIVHGSDSPESAARELELFFG